MEVQYGSTMATREQEICIANVVISIASRDKDGHLSRFPIQIHFVNEVYGKKMLGRHGSDDMSYCFLLWLVMHHLVGTMLMELLFVGVYYLLCIISHQTITEITMVAIYDIPVHNISITIFV
jgi:hypothetical protein